MMDSRVRKNTQIHTAHSLQTQDVDPDSDQAVNYYTTCSLLTESLGTLLEWQRRRKYNQLLVSSEMSEHFQPPLRFALCSMSSFTRDFWWTTSQLIQSSENPPGIGDEEDEIAGNMPCIRSQNHREADVDFEPWVAQIWRILLHSKTNLRVPASVCSNLREAEVQWQLAWHSQHFLCSSPVLPLISLSSSSFLVIERTLHLRERPQK